MSYQVAERGSVQVLKIHNLRDELNNRTILQTIDKKIKAGFHNFVLDLSGLKLINSVGINFLIRAFHKAKDEGCQLMLAGIPANVGKLLQITKLDEHFSISKNVNEAFDFFNKS